MADRRWMYERRDSNGDLSQAFRNGLREFLFVAGNVRHVQLTKVMPCPCRKCKNRIPQDVDTVGTHLYNRGFMPDYYVWYYHGEGYGNETIGSSSNYNQVDLPETSNYNHDHHQHAYEHEVVVNNVSQHHEQVGVDQSRFEDMVYDAFPEVNTYAPIHDDVVEEPNAYAKKFYDMLNSSKQPIYEGCREGLSRLSLATRMMTIKSDHNSSVSQMDDWAALFKEYLPEGNQAADSHYEIQKLVSSLGLPAQTIDVCIDNCMLFWKDDDNLQECRFCQKPRYKPQAAGSRTRVPFQRMWYMPITDRLQRLYHSEQTAEAMRWHADHHSAEGVIKHPSDAKAWRHFQSLYPSFAAEKRNVYLGLCTDGFKPFGMSGRNYSLWPVVLTPYNLPPEMCMQREFLFLSILVPGPKHPKKSLDVFLQPLIDELNELWSNGARTFDFFKQRNFTMRAVLMWTISDFPAYGMLSGWTTHGRLACPYCLSATSAHQLRYGGKSSWFDCHRRFLPASHRYRRNRTLFMRNKAVRLPPPEYLTGEQIETQIDYYGAEYTVDRGGSYFDNPKNMPGGYHDEHNWHKKSIFWTLPYWKDHLLRHNLDVMHVEKNFFENIINTILNVPKKTKDNIKSRLDLAKLCNRPLLHLTDDGKAPVPTFRLKPAAKTALFNWVASDLKFPDGYVSKLSKTVESGQKFGGMKSHDCHVFMQRLLPFAFAELLPQNVHEAIAGIGAFFRDLCARSLTTDGIEQLGSNIPVLLCNLEKIFPPSFFDVMEHVCVHLPYEAELGGPVHFRWMYGFERYFKYLKGKAKNLARVEGSIVQGSLTEEIAHFSSYYFPPTVRTRKRRTRRYDDGGVAPTYPVEGVPDIFSVVGRQGGAVTTVDWSSPEDYNTAHTYILLQCDEITPFESEFIRQVYETFPAASPAEVQKRKLKHFARWMKTQVAYEDESYPMWFRELIQAPLWKVTTSPIYCTRGFVFHTFDRGQDKATANYGVVARAGDVDFYGIIREIIGVTYPGVLRLRCTLFKCDWFDPVVGRGVRLGKFGVVDVNQARSYKHDPYILASQADQVCFVPYPRIRRTGITWLSVQRVAPRGFVIASDDVPMQNESPVDVSAPDESTEDVHLVDTTNPPQPIPDDVEDQENPEDEWNYNVDTTDDEDENDDDETQGANNSEDEE